MLFFKDQHHTDVQLSFIKNSFEIPAKHVLVVLKHDGKWLMTKHAKRGIEFPGGKVEENETLEEAAIREVQEETGAVVKDLKWIADYVVQDHPPFCKAVYTGTVDRIQDITVFLETEGIIWLTDEQFTNEGNLSFHMVDEGMKAIMNQVSLIEK